MFPVIEIESQKVRKSLAELIRNIEDWSEYIPSNIDELKRNEFERAMFEEWEKKNSVVRDVMEDKTTFLKEYEKAFRQYNLGKLLTPYSLPTGFREKVADLVDCIGNHDLDDSIIRKLTGNPVGLGILSAILVGGYRSIKTARESRKKEHKIDRRKFLKILGSAGLAGAVGALYGATGSLDTHLKLNEIKKNAIYLDNVKTRLYKK